MSDQTSHQDFIEKSWKILDLQADTMLKISQNRTEIWKVVVAGMAAGGALVAGTAALLHFGR